MAGVPQAAHGHEQLVDLLRREYGRGFVQDHDIRAAVQDLEDLHALLLPDAEVSGNRIGIHADLVPRRQLGPRVRLRCGCR